MRPLAQSVLADFAGVDFVLTDMDDTLTYRGRLPAATYAALERLQAVAVKVIPVTAAPAGWCDQMARMWPVDAVIGENGGISMLRTTLGVERSFWHADTDELQAQLSALRERLEAKMPFIRVSADQPFRLTSLAFDRPASTEASADLCALFHAAGADTTVNSLWVLGWFGGYDKLIAARRFMHEAYGIDIDAQSDHIVYVGDSTNDAPMFRHFPRSVGVSTVVEYLSEIKTPPAWITQGPGGTGFVEVADAILAARGRVLAR
jgi:HAD superfamily hydrolase (TIGR01484 family)